MLHIEPGLYLRVQQLPNGPHPLPLASGFNTETAYRALGMFNPSETSDAYFIFSNDRDEVWFICNRHLRTVGLFPGRHAVREPLAALQAPAPAGLRRLPGLTPESAHTLPESPVMPELVQAA